MMSSCCQQQQREEAANPLVHDAVKDYYGRRVKTSKDLMTGCCTVDRESFSSKVKEAMKQLHPEVLSKNYGCGAVYPEAVEGCKILDLGSGAGLDCFVLSKLVGPNGHVTGVDMTEEQLDVAKKHIAYHTQKFGYSDPNVEFYEGFIEKLDEVGLESETFDLIISNCVVNLSPNKEAVLKEAYRVLQNGGEMFFSDVYSNKAVPETLKQNRVLWGECISGALEWRELMKIAVRIGFAPPVLVSSVLYIIKDSELKELTEMESSGLEFCSATYRLMKTNSQNLTDFSSKEEPLVEVCYKGTISGHESCVKFSHQVLLKVDSPTIMTSSVSTLLQSCPRLSPHFSFTPLDNQPSQKETTPLTPPLKDFIYINPFEVADRSMELAPPPLDEEANGCGGSTGPPPTKKPCCGQGLC